MALNNNTKSLQDLIAFAKTLPDAITLPTLSNEAAADKLLVGYELIDADGNKITGTMPIQSLSVPTVEISEDGLITAQNSIESGYVAGTTKRGTLQLNTQSARTVTPSYNEQTTIPSQIYTTGDIVVDTVPYSEAIDAAGGTIVDIG